MKRLFKTASAAVACLLMTALAAQAATEKLRIMTFNIPYGNIKVTEGNGQNTWANRAKAIHHYIDSISPDLLGIQEGVRDQLTSILSGIPGYAMVGCAREDGAEKGEYTPILYKTSRFLLEDSGNYWPTDTPDKPSKTPGAICYRVVTWALFTDKETGARFIYTNTHLDHGPESARLAQAQVLKKKMGEMAARYGRRVPQFLTADFNTHRTSPVYDALVNYNLSLRDMWTVAGKKVQNGKDGFSSSVENEIDFIFAYGSVKSTYAELGNRWTPDGFIMSDHNPHFADVRWTTSTADNARVAIMQARAVADSTFQWQKSRTRLITMPSQLSTDGIESSSMLGSLIDRNTDTYVRSRCTGSLPPNNPHYLQVKLREPQKAFSLQYNKSLDGDAGQADRWEDVLVTASHDGEHWDYVTELYKLSGVQNRTYTAEVNMRRPYEYVRFQVMRTHGMRLSNGAPRYSLSEFQMFPCTPVATCEYAKSKTIAQAVDALYDLAGHTQALVDEGNVTSSDVTALKEATQALRQARHDYATPVTGVTASAEPAGEQIYSLSGMRLGALQKGVNIRRASNGTSRLVMAK